MKYKIVRYKSEREDEENEDSNIRYKLIEDEDIEEEREKINNMRILGQYFVKNNRNKGKLVINNKKVQLKEFIPLNDIKDDYLIIKMVLNKYISNLSYMFKDCETLLQLSIYKNFQNIEYKNIYLFPEF